jgi:hypothetical protein
MPETPFRIVHHPSDDEAEAESMAAARVAAETLIKDNEWRGSARIWRGHELMGLFNSGVPDSYAIGGWWKYPEDER